MTLVGYWPLNESSGSTAYDYSGNGINGEINGTVSIDNVGPVGNRAYEFDGGRVDLNFDTSVFSEDIKSGSYWIYPDENYTGGDRRVLDAHTESSGNARWEYAIDYSSGEALWLNHGSPSDHLRSSVGAVPPSEWTHVVITYHRPTNTAKIYINGELDAETNNNADYPISNNGKPIYISRPADGIRLRGRLSELRLYNRALTPAEVQYLYNVSRRGRFVSRKKKV
jgi:hypothetical protein